MNSTSDMQKENRQNFSQAVKNKVGKSVGWKCSRPECRKPTIGPGESQGQPINIGEVAHITAASPGGPRYDCNMSERERTSYENAILLCRECASIIDQNPDYYTVEMLQQWKKEAEAIAKYEFEEGGIRNRYGYTAKKLLPYNTSPALTQIRDIFNKNLKFFPENELEQMENIIQRLGQEDFPYALLVGMPASGKSVFMYEVANRFEKDAYKVYYYTCKEGFLLYDLMQDLNFYEQVNPIGKKLYIIDDIHLAEERVAAFFQRVLNEKLKGSILFVSRNEKSENSSYADIDIYKSLENVKFRLEFSPGSKNSENKKSQQRIKDVSINKIKGIIQTYINSAADPNELRRIGNEDYVQVADKIGYDLLNLRYYLQTWEEENTKNPGIGLNMIEKKDVLKHVYDAMLSKTSPLDRMTIIKYACLYQYEVGFELHINDVNVFEKREGEEGECKLSKENQLYSFYHSKYAELLVESFKDWDEFFDIFYTDLRDLVVVNIKEYIKSYYRNRGRKYPKNLFELYEGILTVRNSNIHEGGLENDLVFNELISDVEIKKITLEFFYHSKIETIRIHKFMDFIKKYSIDSYEEMCEQLVYKDNYAWLKNHLMTFGYTSDFYAFVLFVNDYPEFYQIFDDEELKSLINISGAIAIKQLYQIEDREIQEHIKSLLTEKEWFIKLQESMISQIRDILNNVEREDQDFAIQLWRGFSDDELIDRMNENFIIEMTYTMPLLKKLDMEQRVRILDRYEDGFILKNMIDFIKNHNETKNMQVVSDFIQQLADADKDRALRLLQHIQFADIQSTLETYNFAQISSFFTKLKEVDMDKASELLNKVDIGLLRGKLAELPAQNVINSIAELQRINEKMAKALFEEIKEELVRKIEKIKLETFLSYQGSMTKVQPDTIGEIMGRLSDDYVRGYRNLGDMRDVTRLIELYGCVDFNVWRKEYILDEIIEYVDAHFEEKFLHKKWMPSTIQLLSACAKVNRTIESAGSQESRAVFKQVLLYDENRDKFDYYISIVEKHNLQLAEEIKKLLPGLHSSI